MELDGNNGINLYKQVTPAGLFRKISFSFPGASKPLIMIVYRENQWSVVSAGRSGCLPAAHFPFTIFIHGGERPGMIHDRLP